jgi:hypothetical protein
VWWNGLVVVELNAIVTRNRTPSSDAASARRTFDHLALAVRLARLDEVSTGSVKLEAVLLVSVGNLAHLRKKGTNRSGGIAITFPCSVG